MAFVVQLLHILLYSDFKNSYERHEYLNSAFAWIYLLLQMDSQDSVLMDVLTVYGLVCPSSITSTVEGFCKICSSRKWKQGTPK